MFQSSMKRLVDEYDKPNEFEKMMRKKLKKIEEYAQETQCLDEANKKSMKNF